MTTTGRRLRDPSALPRIATTRRRRLDDPISPGWGVAAAVVWVVLLGVILGVEPPADDPDAVPTAAETLLGLLFLVGATATAVGLAVRRRAGLVASAATGGLVLLTSLACPLTGHHEMAGWWYAQAAAATGLVAFSAAAAARARRSG